MKHLSNALLAGYLISGNIAVASPTIHSDTELSTAGYFQLNWQDESEQSFLLQQSSQADFHDPITLYQGPDQATVISGLPDGDYYYRVANEDHQWSKPVKVTVKHHSLTKALGFFGLGAIMFIVMVTLLIKGATCKNAP